MIKKKCSVCDKKIDTKFSFCPFCGNSLKKSVLREDYGMLGASDSSDIQNNLKLPFGMEKMMGSLIKQLEKQIGDMNFENVDGMPKGIKIRVTRGPPGTKQIINEKPRLIEESRVSEKEVNRRMGLERVSAESKVRRLNDSITYEIDAPGVKSKDDVVLTELATGLEIKAYSKDKCYVKFIPLKLEVLGYNVKSEKVFLELKS